ncbi:tubulin-tyrosine ligase family protein, putative [Ichthyophthirius multifiliis]|uniref:Tubulin-tyrosine ligase family protein, putative n=1 Tax=Ichthyophthirius multifiliis TaxID=5932 RepID=G0QTR4_ICHMU|nr:tubulin-tyrosine ligase family protein, putative [Ichthyophthirius multifiliis]EGR31385.1 tubulin-tyrosine ligase family protein, putative [Ichthyophthirius multifiliis]|eukprot:XP_004034871.1 tubulin-tyrosine ligase family protein, putative [Ichthyophthirius multifiliis]
MQLNLDNLDKSIKILSQRETEELKKCITQKILGEKKIIINKNTLKFQQIHNHFEHNFHLSNKKALFYNLKQYYILIDNHNLIKQKIPLTFHIQNGENDIQYQQFLQTYKQREIENENNIWIIKPGESSNRGNGIQVLEDIRDINTLIKGREKHTNGNIKTFIIQKYIQNTLLYNKRKFDIRQFSLENLENKYIHLTNEAVQKKASGNFGKFEKGNKISFSNFEKYLKKIKNYSFSNIVQQMKNIANETICAAFTKIDPKKRSFSFELFGYDFMLDDNLNVQLLEINTNPSLTVSCNLMSRLIHNLIENTVRIAIDPLFPPPNIHLDHGKLKIDKEKFINSFEILFDSKDEGYRLEKLYENACKDIDIQLEKECENEEVYDEDEYEESDEDEDS